MAEPPPPPPPQVAPRRVRSWWLCFISAWYVPVWLTQSVIQITLPAQVAVFVPSSAAEQYTMLGIASAIGAAMQFAQPFVGAVSDRTRGHAWGGRRTYLVVGQLLSVAGLALMATARGVWWLTWGYALLMFGSSVGYGVYPCIVPELVPPEQVGEASGWSAFAQQSGLLGGAALGFAIGSGLLGNLGTAAVLGALNLLAVATAVLSFNREPSLLWLPEAQKPWGASAAESPTPSEEAVAAVAQPGIVRSLAGFLSPFRSASFSWLCVFIFLNTGSVIVTGTYLQYFLRDICQPHSFDLFGRPMGIDNAQSAAAVYTFVGNIAALLFVVPASALSDRVGRRSLLSAACLLLAAATGPLGWLSSFTPVLILGAVSGLLQGVANGVLNAMMADVSDERNAARDMNLLYSAGTVSQTLVSVGGGQLLSGFATFTEAYRTLWLTTALSLVLSCPVLAFVRPRPEATAEAGAGAAPRAKRRGVPLGAELCDRLLFGARGAGAPDW